LLDGTQAAAHAEALQALHAEVYASNPMTASPAGSWSCAASRASSWPRPATALPGRVRLRSAAPAVDLVVAAAHHPLPDEVTTEHPGRTFALVELAVRASWRRQGIAATLHDLILEDRPEERATLTVPPPAAPAQQAFRKWGWRKVARTRDGGPGSPVSDVLITTLPMHR